MKNHIYEATSTDAIETLLSSLPGVSFVSFFSPTCGPCMMLEPLLEQLAEQGSIHLIRVNVMDYPAIAQQWQVSAWPTNFIYKDHQQVDKIVGFQPLDEWQQLLQKI